MKEPRFLTSPATSFEAMMFLIYIGVVMNCHTRTQGSPCAKRKKVLQNYKVNRETSQRIGFAVQQVIRACDCKVRYMRLKNCEEGIYPYITLTSDDRELCFTVLSSGFAHKNRRIKTQSTLVHSVSLTNVPHKHLAVFQSWIMLSARQQNLF